MEARDYTIQDIFSVDRMHEIPLYQRRYIWDLESQWTPLWEDVEAAALKVLNDPNRHHKPHFLGSVVVQQMLNDPAGVQKCSVIDGQQRLTTLQLLLDAAHAAFEENGLAGDPSTVRLDRLIKNVTSKNRPPHERFKVWPLNIDQSAFEEVMSAPAPVDHDSLTFHDSRFARAHKYFATEIRRFLLADGVEILEERAAALTMAMSENLKLVVISLDKGEDAQEIFETLNARGVRLTSADLIKNYLFQKLIAEQEDANDAYNKFWKEFESPFWEKRISKGRYVEPRLSIYLNQFLVSRIGERVQVEQVFDRFKKYLDRSGFATLSVLEQIFDLAQIYKKLTEASENPNGHLNDIERFVYRIQALDTETVKPLLLSLIDPSLPEVPQEQLFKTLSVLESWLTRRAIIKATGKAYNRVLPQLIVSVQGEGRESAGDVIEHFFRQQTSDSLYWPDDATVARVLSTLSIYTAIPRPRVRMILEAIEDWTRFAGPGATKDKNELPCTRLTYQVEHIMPRSWESNWPLHQGETKDDRAQKVNTIGNLTLLTPTKNSAVSNGPWFGSDPKRQKQPLLEKNTSIWMNRELATTPGTDGWTLAHIISRTAELTKTILKLWPVPAGHSVNPQADNKVSEEGKASVSKLISGGLLEVGCVLELVGGKSAGRTAQVLEDGILRTEDGKEHKSPSGAAVHHRGRPTNGWTDWVLEGTKTRLQDLWSEYVEHFGGEAQDDEAAEDIEEETD